MADYKNTLETLKINNLKLLQSIINDIKTQAQTNVEDFKEILEKETVKSQQLVGEKIDEEYQTLHKELEIYKAKRLKQIDDSVYEILQNVSKKVLGKSIKLNDQEELVLDSLAEAKKEGLF